MGISVTPQVSVSCYDGRFILISDAQWKFLFLARVCLWLSRLFIHISPNSELFNLTEGRIWSLLKLLFLGTNANSIIILNLSNSFKARLIKCSTGASRAVSDSDFSMFDLCPKINLTPNLAVLEIRIKSEIGETFTSNLINGDKRDQEIENLTERTRLG